MPRLIDADSLKTVLDELLSEYPRIEGGGFAIGGIRKGIAMALRAVCNAPTLDYAPVRHGEWISVKDRLPEHETPVLVGYSRNLDGFVSIGYLDYEDMRWCGLDDIRIARPTHWMPLPETPKEEA